MAAPPLLFTHGRPCSVPLTMCSGSRFACVFWVWGKSQALCSRLCAAIALDKNLVQYFQACFGLLQAQLTILIAPVLYNHSRHACIHPTGDSSSLDDSSQD